MNKPRMYLDKDGKKKLFIKLSSGRKLYLPVSGDTMKSSDLHLYQFIAELVDTEVRKALSELITEVKKIKEKVK